MKLRRLATAGLAVFALAGCGGAAAASTADPAQAPIGLTVPSTPAIAPAASPAPASVIPSVSEGRGAPSSETAPEPVASPAARVQPSPLAVPVAATPASIRLGPLQYIRQTLNNCGPAAIAEVLRYWGIERTQAQVQAVLRPIPNSRGMMPYPVPAYIKGLGMNALMGVGGTDALVKALVSNGFPVIVSQWVSASDHEGHYREIEGFDDSRGVFISTDSYVGPNHEISYPEFNQIWTGNQRFMVIYPPAKQPLFDAVTASVNWNKAAAYQADLLRQQRHGPTDLERFRMASRPGFAKLSLAWDHIQLGDFTTASAEIQSAAAQGAPQPMVQWLQQALSAVQ